MQEEPEKCLFWGWSYFQQLRSLEQDKTLCLNVSDMLTPSLPVCLSFYLCLSWTVDKHIC